MKTKRAASRRPCSPPPTREFEQYFTIVRRLRRECPWDRKQTHRTLRAGLLEEAYEAAEAMDRGRAGDLKSELGDLLLHLMLHAAIAEEAGEFTLRDVLDEGADKLIRRHPHVFGEMRLKTAADVLRSWDRLKMREGRKSVLDGVPGVLPALARAERLQARASRVGFDWKRREEVWEKVSEELEELRAAVRRGSRSGQREELGDLLFSLVNYARFLKIDPEDALNASNRKFVRRFRAVERELSRRGTSPADSSLEEMDAIWDDAKRRKRKPRGRRPSSR